MSLGFLTPFQTKESLPWQGSIPNRYLSFGSWSLLLGMYCCCQLAWYDSELICPTVAPAFQSLS